MSDSSLSNTAECVSGETWDQLLRGDDLSDWIGSLREHCSHCPSCARQLKQVLQHLAAQGDEALQAVGRRADETSVSTGSGTHGGLVEPCTALDIPLAASIQDASDFSWVSKLCRAVLPARTEQLPRQLGPYELREELGHGGMGCVYKAWHGALRRFVAIKLPYSLGEEGQRRFFREARAAAQLNHPAICRICDMGQASDATYLVMEYVEGPTLLETLEQRRLDPREAANLMKKLARGVAYAHDHGIVHRDIKPANIILRAGGAAPVLMDFGLAKDLGAEDGTSTQAGQVIGTPAYMAPEQAAGECDQVGTASDVYALGAVLYHCVCGKPPYEGPSRKVLAEVLQANPILPRDHRVDVPRDLEAIMLQAMAPTPDARYATAGGFADDLDRFLAGRPVAARRLRWGGRLWNRLKRHPQQTLAWLVASGLTAVLAAWTIYFLLQGGAF